MNRILSGFTKAVVLTDFLLVVKGADAETPGSVAKVYGRIQIVDAFP